MPRRPVPKYIDTASGNSRDLVPSGLYPKVFKISKKKSKKFTKNIQYSQKDDYGKVPGYIIQRNKEAAEAQREYDAYIKVGGKMARNLKFIFQKGASPSGINETNERSRAE